MYEIFDKWNWKNFIGYKDWKAYEIMRCGGRFYLIKFSLDWGIIPYGNPLVKWKDFVFWKD